MANNLATVEPIKATRLTAITLFPPRLAEIFSNIDAPILEMTELELEEQFNRTPNDYALRKRLWDLVTEAQFIPGKTLSFGEWARGVVQDAHLHNNVFNNPFRLAWLFTPLSTFSEQYEEMFHVLFAKFRKKVVGMHITDDNMTAAVKLLENLANRVLGPVPKNINLRAQHVHANQPQKAAPDPDKIDQKLKELEGEKDVTPVVDLEPG